MKIITNNPKDLYEGSYEVNIETNNYKGGVRFGRGEPEDNNLARDLNDAFKIDTMLIAAYNAGKNGETLEEIVEEED